MDEARRRTDKELNKIESKIGRIYESSPALKRIEKEYAAYMKKVQEKTADLYREYKETGEGKKAYTDAVRELTVNSAEYNKLVKKFTEVMAQVNSEALAVSNDAMVDVYCINYNQVAVECKRVGIRVDG